VTRRHGDSKYPDSHTDDCENDEDEDGDRVAKFPHHAARSEYKMVLATVPFPARPIEKKTGLSRPGTFTLRTRMEYAGELAGQVVRPCRTKQ
jgi:hypothetical protein